MTPKCLGATAPRFVEGTGALPRAKLGDFGLSRRSPADLGFKWYVHWVCRIPIGNSAQWASAKCRVSHWVWIQVSLQDGARHGRKLEMDGTGNCYRRGRDCETKLVDIQWPKRPKSPHWWLLSWSLRPIIVPRKVGMYSYISIICCKWKCCTIIMVNNYSKVPLYLHHFRWLTSGHDRSPCWSQEQLYCPWLEMLGVTLCPMEPQHIARTSEFYPILPEYFRKINPKNIQ